MGGDVLNGGLVADGRVVQPINVADVADEFGRSGPKILEGFTSLPGGLRRRPFWLLLLLLLLTPPGLGPGAGVGGGGGLFVGGNVLLVESNPISAMNLTSSDLNFFSNILSFLPIIFSIFALFARAASFAVSASSSANSSSLKPLFNSSNSSLIIWSRANFSSSDDKSSVT